MEEILTNPATFGAFIQLFKLGLDFSKAILDSPWKPNESDENAAWAMYVEMVTRVITQPLPPDSGDEKAALESVHSLFQSTRDVLKEHGRDCNEFPKIAIEILNQRVRPFTTEWHRRSLEGAFECDTERGQFRQDLASLQETLHAYTRALAKTAKIEDLTNLSEE